MIREIFQKMKILILILPILFFLGFILLLEYFHVGALGGILLIVGGIVAFVEATSYRPDKMRHVPVKSPRRFSFFTMITVILTASYVYYLFHNYSRLLAVSQPTPYGMLQLNTMGAAVMLGTTGFIIGCVNVARVKNRLERTLYWICLDLCYVMFVSIYLLYGIDKPITVGDEIVTGMYLVVITLALVTVGISSLRKFGNSHPLQKN
jgi:hypothetical protein